MCVILLYAPMIDLAIFHMYMYMYTMIELTQVFMKAIMTLIVQGS